MSRAVLLVVLGSALAIAASGSVSACATSEPVDLSSDVDPTLPSVDAGGTSIPVPRGDAGGSSSGSSDATEEDSSAPPSDESGSSGASSSGASSSGGSSGASSSGGSSGSSGSSGAPKPAQGEVLITEVMYNPFGTEPDTEWFELHNVTASARSLSGLTIADGGGRTHTIGAGVTIAPGAYVVFARATSAAVAAKVPAASIAYEYGEKLPSNAGIQLANGDTGGLSLKSGGTTIAQAPYGGWFSQSGGSTAQLDVLDYAASASEASWCLSSTAWTAGSDKGTPGAASDCP
jgi:hypothetical protein